MTCVATEIRRLIPVAGPMMRILDADGGVEHGASVLLGHSYLWDGEMWRP